MKTSDRLFQFLCLSCGQATRINECKNDGGLCDCGDDNFLNIGDTVLTTSGYVISVKEIQPKQFSSLCGHTYEYDKARSVLPSHGY